MDVEDIVADTQKEDASRTLRKYVAELVRSLERVLEKKVRRRSPMRLRACMQPTAGTASGMRLCHREA
jgi:hypothetical protein